MSHSQMIARLLHRLSGWVALAGLLSFLFLSFHEAQTKLDWTGRTLTLKAGETISTLPLLMIFLGFLIAFCISWISRRFAPDGGYDEPDDSAQPSIFGEGHTREWKRGQAWLHNWHDPE